MLIEHWICGRVLILDELKKSSTYTDMMRLKIAAIFADQILANMVKHDE
jgi:hypothetical protein